MHSAVRVLGMATLRMRDPLGASYFDKKGWVKVTNILNYNCHFQTYSDKGEKINGKEEVRYKWGKEWGWQLSDCPIYYILKFRIISR